MNRQRVRAPPMGKGSGTVVTASTHALETSEIPGHGLSDIASALIVFSHLRWSGVYQRPQHLLSRFAKHIPVIVIEEPVLLSNSNEKPSFRETSDGNVTVLTPLLPDSSTSQFGFCKETNRIISRLIEERFPRSSWWGGQRFGSGSAHSHKPVVWYYTPMALGALPGSIDPGLVVLDAMDDLASFRNAPRELRDQEEAMLRTADVIFAGGPSLYEARRHRHPSVHCFPSGVDARHFATGAESMAPAADIAALPGPVLGFHGVLDERIDFDLIAKVADSRPNWSLALVGPLAKIEESDLPRRPNISYLGRQQYADLPSFLAGFDVAILPFALNEATRSISPTKTLEYLAAEKPVVSTAIADVVSLYGNVVRIASDPADFITAVEAALAESGGDRRRRHARAQAHLLEHDWDAIADGMADRMIETVTARSEILNRPPASEAWEMGNNHV